MKKEMLNIRVQNIYYGIRLMQIDPFAPSNQSIIDLNIEQASVIVHWLEEAIAEANNEK